MQILMKVIKIILIHFLLETCFSLCWVIDAGELAPPCIPSKAHFNKQVILIEEFERYDIQK